MESGILDLWLPSHAMLDILYLDQVQELVRSLEIRMVKPQNAMKVIIMTAHFLLPSTN